MQRAVGYSLTGLTDEQCLFIAHGFGANGKSVFINTVKSLLGPYGRQTAAETLMAKRGGGVQNDIAALAGARLAAATESDDGHRLAESLVKQITGDDTISARFLYSEWFEFKPQFKLWLATNHKPVIRGDDHAIWRRIQLVPFTVTIPPEEQDPKLTRKLEAETAGILAWAVRGCLDWQKRGLRPPTVVTAATAEYRSDSDIFGDFLDQCCNSKGDGFTPTNRLYAAYRSWADDSGHRAMTETSFGRKLTERGFKKHRDRNQGRGFLGIELQYAEGAKQWKMS